MKLFIESVFDKDVNNLEDAEKKAIEAANQIEAQHGNLAAGKVYYFATKINKLIIATGNIGKQAMMIKNPILAIKDIPDIKIGDIPTKFAKYQELVIPSLDLEQQRVIFTKIKDMSEDDVVTGQFELVEIPTSNPIYDIEGYKVEFLTKQPKPIKIRTAFTTKAKVAFKLLTLLKSGIADNTYEIVINSKRIVIYVDTSVDYKSYVKENTTPFDVNINVSLKGYKTPDELKDKITTDRLITIDVVLEGYFTPTTNISIIPHTSRGVMGYVQKSIELLEIHPYRIPEPFNCCAKLDQAVYHQPLTIQKTIQDGITVGGIMSVKSASKLFRAESKDDNTKGVLVYIDTKNIVNVAIAGKTIRTNIKFDKYNKGFTFMFGFDFKSNTAIVSIDDETQMFNISKYSPKLPFDYFKIGDDNKVNYIENVWHYIGDVSDINS